jgi:hypothetical protein
LDSGIFNSTRLAPLRANISHYPHVDVDLDLDILVEDILREPGL